MNMSIAELQKHRVRRELPRIEAAIQTLIAHINNLSTLVVLDPRLVLSQVNQAKTLAIQLRLQFLSIVSEVGSLERTRCGSDRAELRASAKRLDILFTELREAVARIDTVVAERLNDMGRWGDAALAGPVQAFVGLMNTLLEIWYLEKVRYRLGANEASSRRPRAP
jgi:cytidylate kinase